MTLTDGQLSAGEKTAPISEFVAAASQLTAPAEPKLKDPSEFTVIGNSETGRVDNAAKTTGQAQYAMDVHLEGQIVAVMLRSPRFGGKLVSMNDSAAKEVPGFIRAAALPTGTGAVVYAKNTWSAFQARNAITAEWDFSAAESRSSDQIKADLVAAVNAMPEYSARGDLSATEAALEGAAQIIEQEFYFPNLAHAPMEPLTCTIAPTENGVILYDGCQSPAGGQGALAAVLRIRRKPCRSRRFMRVVRSGAGRRRSRITMSRRP